MTIIANNPQIFLGKISGGNWVNYHYDIFTANIGSAFLREISIVYKAIASGVLWIPSDGNDERSLGGFGKIIWQVFFLCGLIQRGSFEGIQNNLKIHGGAHILGQHSSV